MRLLLDKPNTPDLAAIAYAAYAGDLERGRQALAAERKRQVEWADLRISERTRRLLETRLGYSIPLTPNIIDGPLVRVGDLWFTSEQDWRGSWHLALVTRCQTCAAVLYRDEFESLGQLGHVLALAANRDTSCTFCVPSNLPYLRSFDADAAYPERAE